MPRRGTTLIDAIDVKPSQNAPSTNPTKRQYSQAAYNENNLASLRSSMLLIISVVWSYINVAVIILFFFIMYIYLLV